MIGQFRAYLRSLWYSEDNRLTPDGLFYLAQADGEDVPRPYRFRFLLPRLLGTSRHSWLRMNTVSLVLLAAGLWVYTGSPVSMLFLACFPLVRFWRAVPILQDVPAIAISLWAAIAMGINVELGLATAVLAGLINEKAPLFAALYAWSPLPLIGYLGVGVVYLLTREGLIPRRVQDYPELYHEMQQVLGQPVRSALRYMKGQAHNAKMWVQPWGGMALCVFNSDLHLLVTISTATVMTFMATDSIRMMVWALPVVVASLLELPWEMVILAAGISWFWGWHGREI